jgi:type II secretory pathway pseudopilin PulG
MKKRTHESIAAYSLVEILIGLVLLIVIGGIAYSILVSATALMAKNVSLNASGTTLRTALDRVYSGVNQANGLPKLLNADGSPVGSGAGPAAGIIFDRYLGGPYIVANPGNGLPGTTISFTMTSSTDPLASPPVPQRNDVVSMDAGVTRPLVQSCSASTSAGLQTLTVQLQSAIGKDIPWTASTQKTAYLIHREGFIVVPNGGRAELRFYRNAETLGTANYNDATTYVVLTRDVGTGTGETTPFSIVTQGSTSFLNIAMRIEDRQYNSYLAARQAKEFNTFLRVDTTLRPRNFL